MFSKHKRLFLLQTVVLLLIIPLAGLLAQEDFDNNVISFKYGIIGKTKDNPDVLFEVSDNSVLYTGDFIKINFKMECKGNYYGIFKFSNGEYYLFSSSVNLHEKNYPEKVVTSLDWFELDGSVGTENIYFIASKEPISKLMDLFVKYQDANNKLKEKWATAISREIDEIAQLKNQELELLTTRLQEPESIGATIRGMTTDDNFEDKLFHHCSGKTIAFKNISIIHK